MAGWHGGGREGVTRGQGRGDVWRDQTCWTVYVGDQTSDSVPGEEKMLFHSLNALQLAAILSDTSLHWAPRRQYPSSVQDFPTKTTNR